MYYVSTKVHFDAAHHLVGYKGNCGRCHGHRWEVECLVYGDKLKNGILVDFKDIKKKLNPILKKLDHHDLNKVVKFNPTAENLAKYIFDKMWPLVCQVKVWESPDSFAAYGADDVIE